MGFLMFEGESVFLRGDEGLGLRGLKISVFLFLRDMEMKIFELIEDSESVTIVRWEAEKIFRAVAIARSWP